ncbi:catalase [Paenibacillus sp. UNC451MF]|uniref:catalase n=1 Tax=Paenibacillus sp. UNC451MF TaxID=1449063 RepID=UPI003FA7EB09
MVFSPSNLLYGAEFSDDKILQGRTKIYWYSQRRQLGPDFRRFRLIISRTGRPIPL